MTILYIVAIVLLGLAALVFTVGTFTPRNHAVSVRTKIARPPAEVWSAITDLDALPTWKPDVESVERRPDVDGRASWFEHTRHRPLPLRVEESVPPRKLVVRIDDTEERLAFGGTWTWSLREVAGGTEVTLTENGFVSNVLFRVIAHYFMGYACTIERTLNALGSRLGEPIVVRRV